jgi:glycosyltransferase involved in cell wall biosynthesis
MKQDEPLVSVIMPTYNRAYIIRHAIDSVRKQTYQNWELVIVDDGSNDDTKSVAKAYKDQRIRYLFKKNGGPCAARNYGIARAKGTWITYLDSDDVLYPPCLATMVKHLQEHPDKVFAIPRGNRSLDLYQNGKLVKSVDDSDDMPEAFTVKDIFMRNARFACLGFMHLRRLYDEGLRWDEQIGAMEEWEFLMTIGEQYPGGFLYVPEVLYDYHQRFGGDGRCSESDYQTWADVFEYAYQKHKGDNMMKGQTWYPEKVEKWRKRQAEFEAGKRPAYQYHYFQENKQG